MTRPPFISGRRPTRGELDGFRGCTVDDLIPEVLRLLFVGINPGLWTAAVNAHFARPGNRFWPAVHEAGLTRELVDASEGLPVQVREELLANGIGISNIVPIATARADELTRADYEKGGERLRGLIRRHRPTVVAVLGVTAWRQAFSVPSASIGHSPDPFEGADLWILPNPSGLNAHESVASLASWYRQAAQAAGIGVSG